jgi:hypothetical protein
MTAKSRNRSILSLILLAFAIVNFAVAAQAPSPVKRLAASVFESDRARDIAQTEKKISYGRSQGMAPEKLLNLSSKLS